MLTDKQNFYPECIRTWMLFYLPSLMTVNNGTNHVMATLCISHLCMNGVMRNSLLHIAYHIAGLENVYRKVKRIDCLDRSWMGGINLKFRVVLMMTWQKHSHRIDVILVSIYWLSWINSNFCYLETFLADSGRSSWAENWKSILPIWLRYNANVVKDQNISWNPV